MAEKLKTSGDLLHPSVCTGGAQTATRDPTGPVAGPARALQPHKALLSGVDEAQHSRQLSEGRGEGAH